MPHSRARPDPTRRSCEAFDIATRQSQSEIKRKGVVWSHARKRHLARENRQSKSLFAMRQANERIGNLKVSSP